MTTEDQIMMRRHIVLAAQEINFLALDDETDAGEPCYPALSDVARRQIYDLTKQIRFWADQLAAEPDDAD